MKEDRSRETKSIDNVIDGEVVRKYDEDTGIIEGQVLRSVAGKSEIDNRIIESNIGEGIVKDESVRNKKDDLIVVDGDELGEYRDFKELSMTAKKYYAEVIQGTSVIRDDIGRVEFNKRGIKETISTASGYTDILKVIPLIKEIIKQGKNLGERKANKERKDKAIFIGIELYVNFNKEKRKVTVLLRKHPFGLDFYTLYLDLDLNKENKKD
jgi:hypothetical protein